MAKRVRAIPATISRYTAEPINSRKKRKVAGYARVSTDHDDQVTSYEAQVDYYTNYIKGRDDWEFVGMYTDEGISATNTRHRDGFKRMVKDALDGKIDLIVTKSVSRFARNTVDSLTTVRKLKDQGIEIYFEKENIWTLDAKGELLITIMSSLAQEESRSISENVTWGHRKRFADGKVSVAYSRFLGYKKGPNGGLVIVPEEAKTVKLIYKLFMEGLGITTIAKELTKRGLKTPAGKQKWSATTISSILQNEKYKGDALLQKSYTVDFLTKKTKINEGEVPQYYVEHDHEAIIEPQLFDLVQEEMKRRGKARKYFSGTSIFSMKIQCAECGGWYGAKVWHSNDKYRRIIYQCNNKFRNKTGCRTPHLTEDEIKTYFIRAMHRLITEKDDILHSIEDARQVICDNQQMFDKRDAMQNEISVLVEMAQNAMKRNARVAQDQDDYQKRYDEIINRYNTMKAEYEQLCEKIEKRQARYEQLGQFMEELKKRESLLTDFDPSLWCVLVDKMVVRNKEDVTLIFKDGTKIKVCG